jgi:hypothetical protein
MCDCVPEQQAHESIRIRHLRERLAHVKIASDSVPDPCPHCKTDVNDTKLAARANNQSTTPNSEHQRILASVTACPIFHVHPESQSHCAPRQQTVATSIGIKSFSVYAASSPTDLIHIRSHHRIRGIEEIARVVRSRSGSEITARIREQNARVFKQSQRHREHRRPQLPAAPCPPDPAPQPGVPIAPQTACNPGTQRVDYSSPIG